MSDRLVRGRRLDQCQLRLDADALFSHRRLNHAGRECNERRNDQLGRDTEPSRCRFCCAHSWR